MSWPQRIFLAMVAVLPLHTVALEAWISWKPFLIALIGLAAHQSWQGTKERSWPWHAAASLGLLALLVATAASWPGGDVTPRYLRLLLALGVGGAVMLVTARMLASPAMWRAMLRTIYWSGAAMVVTAVAIELAATGALGSWALDAANSWPGVDIVTREAYLDEGFVALTNWHEDPGYSAAWTNLWLALGTIAVVRGLGSGRRLVDAVVLGGLVLAVVLTFSRTGWLGLAVAGVVVAVGLVLAKETTWPAVARLGGQSALAALVLLGGLWLADRPGEGGDIDDAIAFRLEQNLSLGPGPAGDATSDPGLDLVDYRGAVWPRYVDFFEEDPLRGAGLAYGWEEPGL